MHEKNAKSSKVREQTNVERKDDLYEEKLAVISFLPNARALLDFAFFSCTSSSIPLTLWKTGYVTGYFIV